MLMYACGRTNKIYKYDELSPAAQERARDWFRGCPDDSFEESVIDDFKEAAKACGFEIGGRNRNNPSDKGIYWSLGYTQGDGASFTGSWSASRVKVAELLKNRPATYKDENGKECVCKSNQRLAVVLEGFAKLAAADHEARGKVSASHRGHSLICEYDTELDYLEHPNVDDCETEIAARSDLFKDLANDLAHWLYWAIREENDYANADEQVAENIRANEYEFTEEGERI